MKRRRSGADPRRRTAGRQRRPTRSARPETRQSRTTWNGWSLSTLLDESIRLPGGYRIGIDPIVGVLPVVGDVLASAVSVYIVLEAAYLGVPRATLARMGLYVLVDTVVGSVPVVGPVFDAVFKANARNVALLEQRLEDPRAGGADRRALLAVGVFFVALAVILAAATGIAAWWLAGHLGLV